MSDDNFEEIVNADQDDEYPEFNDMMDVLFFFYKKFNPGSIPVKGIFIVESTAPGVPPSRRGGYQQSHVSMGGHRTS